MANLFLYRRRAPGLSFSLLMVLFVILLVAGGASRADALGQIVVRTAAWGAVIIVVLFARAPGAAARRQGRPVALLLAAAAALATLQLVPLPPALWQALPGRALLTEAAAASGQPQPWRPWSIVPGATLNALSSLIVPAAVLVLLTGLEADERRRLPGFLLGLVTASTLLGLLQVSGATFDNPLLNDTVGEVGGSFANRNHFALFLALGCLLAPAWAFWDGAGSRWRSLAALGLVVLFVLTILATGSRAGLLLGVLAAGLGLILARQGAGKALRRYPRWMLVLLVAGAVAVVAAFVAISIAADRAAAVQRALTVDAGQDIRSRALPTVLEMIRLYFPMGSGLGGFDPLFRVHEPFGLLKLTYFNHAHDDVLEIILQTGIFGLLLLLSAVLWWAWASVSAWRSDAVAGGISRKLGSGWLLLVLIASLFDYAARTPMIMAMITVAGVWLCGAPEARRGSALPKPDHHL